MLILLQQCGQYFVYMGKKIEVKKGDRYGNYQVIKEIKPRVTPCGSTKRMILCVCLLCKKTHEVQMNNLRSGAVKSCICVRFKHGFKRNNPTYQTWIDMKRRCIDTRVRSYRLYGARGIKYNPKWEDFREFLKDMGERPEGKTLDRIDNNGNYCKENCRWATAEQQNNNSRNNHFVTFEGETLTITQWARRMGIGSGTLFARIYKKWPIKKALTTPVL